MEKEDMLEVGYVDGCFDLMHSGHFNAILQAKKMCKKLVVGIHSNEEIERNKGPPVMTQSERYEMLNHIKWVDEIAYDVPYSPSLDILDKYGCEKAFHGDDMPVNSAGVGAYDSLRDAGRLQIFPRTEGLSTTDFIGRLMALSNNRNGDTIAETTLATKGIHILQSTNRIVEFAQPYRPRHASDKVVYIDGTFDIFNIGHATTLKMAKELGSYLIVGLYSDHVATNLKGFSPMSTLFERMLCVLSCKYVDCVLMDVPIIVTEDMLSSLHVNTVVCGSHTRTNYRTYSDGKFETEHTNEYNIFTDPNGAYEIPKKRGMFVEIQSQFPALGIDVFVHRVTTHREAYIVRNTERVCKEQNYYKEKNESAKSVSCV